MFADNAFLLNNAFKYADNAHISSREKSCIYSCKESFRKQIVWIKNANRVQHGTHSLIWRNEKVHEWGSLFLPVAPSTDKPLVQLPFHRLGASGQRHRARTHHYSGAISSRRPSPFPSPIFLFSFTVAQTPKHSHPSYSSFLPSPSPKPLLFSNIQKTSIKIPYCSVYIAKLNSVVS